MIADCETTIRNAVRARRWCCTCEDHILFSLGLTKGAHGLPVPSTGFASVQDVKPGLVPSQLSDLPHLIFSISRTSLAGLFIHPRKAHPPPPLPHPHRCNFRVSLTGSAFAQTEVKERFNVSIVNLGGGLVVFGNGTVSMPRSV